MLHRLAVLGLQLVAGLVEHAYGEILELLAHDVELFAELLLPELCLGGVLLLLHFQRVGGHLGLHVQPGVAAVGNEVGDEYAQQGACDECEYDCSHRVILCSFYDSTACRYA